MPGGLCRTTLPRSVAASEVRVSLSSIIEFAFLCITSVPPSVVFGGVITLWTIIALVLLTEV